MPELPEVETTRAGIVPHIQGQILQHVVIRDPPFALASAH